MMEDNDMQFSSSFQGTYSSNECFTLQMPFQNVVEQLQKSESLLCNFVNQLEDKAHTPISNVMDSFCQKYRSFQILGSQLQNLVNKRIQRMIKNKRIKRNWNREDEKIIVWVLSKYMERHSINSISNLKQQHWEEISSLIPGSTPNTCMFKILSMKKVKLAAKKWSQQEEKILIKLVEEQLRQSSKKKWRLISQRLFLENEEEGKIYRDPKQCKQHWNCHLNPELKKGPWTKQDDARFLKYIRDNNGKKRWVQMIKVFPTRTQNSLKNRYALLMNQLKKKYPKKNDEKERISSFLNKIDSDNRNIQINRIKEKEKKKVGKSLTDEEENRDIMNKSKILPLDLSQPQECPFQLMNYQERNFMTASPQQQYSCIVCWYVPNIFYLSQ